MPAPAVAPTSISASASAGRGPGEQVVPGRRCRQPVVLPRPDRPARHFVADQPE